MTGTPVSRVLIVGGGACGAFHGSFLALLPNVQVSVVCRSNYHAVRDGGFTLSLRDNVANTTTQRIFKPHHVFSSVEEAAASKAQFDHVALFAKATTSSRSEQILSPLLTLPNLSSMKTISLWQNGIGIEDGLTTALSTLANASPTAFNTALVSTVMYTAISQTAPSIIDANTTQRAVAGLVPYASGSGVESQAGNLDHLAAIMHAAHLNFTVLPDVQVARWHKVLWNASIGLLGLVGGCADSKMVLDTQLGQVIELMKEIGATAEAVLGRPLPYDEMGSFEELIALTKTLGAYKASIILDWQAHREIESQVLFGNIIHKANEAGVPVPRLESLHSAVQLMEGQRKAN
ncbi:hypothetical protein BC830DRAFT_1164462 [Chytriomyces sp. MP71]|nr:hypothetical protein BC830DRAFT_1164462 [Chytriomyces sp. MP71]